MSTNAVRGGEPERHAASGGGSIHRRVSELANSILRGYGGAVAAGHHLAGQVGAAMLADGGNAADAACAMVRLGCSSPP
jgi:gamma-glutamyltranspeptidase